MNVSSDSFINFITAVLGLAKLVVTLLHVKSLKVSLFYVVICLGTGLIGDFLFVTRTLKISVIDRESLI